MARRIVLVLFALTAALVAGITTAFRIVLADEDRARHMSRGNGA